MPIMRNKNAGAGQRSSANAGGFARKDFAADNVSLVPKRLQTPALDAYDAALAFRKRAIESRDPVELDQLARRMEPLTSFNVATNKAASAATIDFLTTVSRSDATKLSLAIHPAASAEAIATLARDRSPAVRYRAKRHPQYRAETVRERIGLAVDVFLNGRRPTLTAA